MLNAISFPSCLVLFIRTRAEFFLIAQTFRGPHKMDSLVACGPRVADPWRRRRQRYRRFCSINVVTQDCPHRVLRTIASKYKWKVGVKRDQQGLAETALSLLSKASNIHLSTRTQLFLPSMHIGDATSA
jgi:hypothetical protein